jgi:hypothetical protein
MGKNQSASGLTNVIQYDNRGNISFVSGSTTLMQVSSSGAITTTGVISGSSAQSASLAQNSNLLQGTGSVGFATTSSFATASGSISTRVTQIEQVYATTGSNSFRATQSITGSLTVTGQIIAQTLNVQQVTSSIVFSSGSNTFGCDLNSRQTFTGSVLMTGSLIVNANNSCFSGIITGGSDIILCGTNGNVYGGTSAGSGTISNNNGSTYARFFGACHATAPNTTAFINGNSTTLTLNANNTATFTNSVCAPNINLSNGISINACSTVTVADWYNTNTNDGNGLYIKAGGVNAGKYIMALENATGASRMIVLANGNVGIGIPNPSSILHVHNAVAPSVITNSTYNCVCSAWNASDGSIVFFGALTNHPLQLTTNNTTRLTIANTGPATFTCSICLAGGNIFLPGAIGGRTSQIEFGNSGTADILGMPNLSSTFYLSYDCNSIKFRNDSGGGQTILQMYCNRTVDVGGNLNASGGLTSTTQKIKNSAGGFATMVHKVQGAAGSFSSVTICVNLKGAGGYGYIVNAGGTSGASFQSGGGYTNGQGNFSHGIAVGSGYVGSCAACSGTDNILRLVGPGGIHPFVSIQMFGSLQQDFDDSDISIHYA